MQENKLSLLSAIFINVNIMIGAGIFVNTTQLINAVGVLGSFSYLIGGALMLPLILAIAYLLQLFPAGGFYTFGSQINDSVGFFSAWSYFVGKLASAVVMVFTGSTLLLVLIPALAGVHPVVLSAIIVIVFGLLNLLNARTGSNIQFIFFIAKLIPIFVVIMSGFFYVTPEMMMSASHAWAEIPASLPFVVFAIAGFEAACSLSSRIENAEKNAPRAILGSFALVMILYSLYQISAYVFATLYGQTLHDYKDFFTLVATRLDGVIFALPQWQFLFYITVILSTLGAAYGVLFSNVWNLHILAHKDHLIGSETIKKYNRHGIPFWCVIAEVIVCLIYLATCLGDYIALIYVGSTGCVLGYLISVLALCYLKVQDNLSISWVLAGGAVGSCLLLSALCVTSLFTGSIVAFSVYCTLVCAGLVSMQIKKRLQ